jgi:pimeloyl-ACP methyl ester carboxylesterase
MGSFASYDGTRLAYHEKGTGAPLVCVPGGPMRASAYLGDLGGLSAHRRLILLDMRGTGDSATPEDPASYQCERLVEDVEALRLQLGLDRIDVLSHSAAGNVVTLYAARYPERVAHAVLVAPGWRATGLEFTDEEWIAAMRRREGEPWYAEAFAAMMRLEAGSEDPADRAAAARFYFGPWTDAAREFVDTEDAQVAREAQRAFREGRFGDPARTRVALTRLTAPVLLLGGEFDPAPTPRLLGEYAGWFPHATVVIQPGAGHNPWMDDPGRFVASVAAFLANG